MRRRPHPARQRGRGFSLVELAVVMVIVAFLLGGLLYTLSAQTEQRNFEETRRRLEQARELILAFAIINGRLPCPARSAATAAPVTVVGDEVLTAAGCVGDGVTDYYGGTNGGVTLGLLPARSIGYQQVDSSGFAVDAWGNRIRYAVANATTPAGPCPTPHFVNAANLKNNGISCQPNDLLICKTTNVVPAPSAPTPSTPSCGGPVAGANQIMTKSLVVAIIFSTGKNGVAGGLGADELANLNGAGNTDPVFVYHTPTPSGAGGGEFDDLFTWITTGELYVKMIAAGVLP
jgi:prepilin-type N-terminal cleavage/methylation domain-containing protein